MGPADRLLTAGVRLPKQRYATPEARLHFFEQLAPRIGALPSVTHVAVASSLPGIGAESRHIEIERTNLANPAQGPSASVLVQFPGYFAAINLPILLGRDFNNTDGAAGRQSAIVTKEFAEKHWPHQAAIGKRFRFYTKDKPGEWIGVIGVSANIVQDPNEKAPNPLLFLPYRQETPDSMALLIRSAAIRLSWLPRAHCRAEPGSGPAAARCKNTCQRRGTYAMVPPRVWQCIFGLRLDRARDGVGRLVRGDGAGGQQPYPRDRRAYGARSYRAYILSLVLGRGLKQLIAALCSDWRRRFPPPG